jgi:hypothetical protein
VRHDWETVIAPSDLDTNVGVIPTGTICAHRWQLAGKVGGGLAHKMPLVEFVRRIAEREGMPADGASAHARAVLNTVRDAVVKKEWHDISSELPRSYLQGLAEP